MPSIWDGQRFAIGLAILGIPAAIVLTILGVRMKDFTLLFIIAWAISCASAWVFCRWIPNSRIRWIVSFLFAPLVIAIFLYGIDSAYPGAEAKAVTIVWDNPAPILAGVPLSKDQLNAIAMSDGKRVDGTYVYDPSFEDKPAPPTRTLHVKFTPTDLTAYRENEKTVVIQVNPPQVKETSGTPSPPPPPFSVDIGPIIFSPARNRAAFFLQSPGPGFKVLFPVNVMAMIRVTNLQPYDSNIVNFEVLSKAKDRWIPLTHVLSEGKKTFFAANMKEGVEYNLSHLDEALTSAPIKPHEMREGWAYFEYPDEGVAFGSEISIRIRDSGGAQFTSGSQHVDSSSIRGGYFLPVGKEDLSADRVQFYPDNTARQP